MDFFGRIANLLFQAVTSDLSEINDLKKLKSNIEDFNGKGKGNNPYNVYSNPSKEAMGIMKSGWNDLKDELGKLELSPEGASMNQGVRGIAYNDDNTFKDKGKSGNLGNNIPLANDYLNQNRNSLDKISQKYTNTEYVDEMINSKIQSHKGIN